MPSIDIHLNYNRHRDHNNIIAESKFSVTKLYIFKIVY